MHIFFWDHVLVTFHQETSEILTQFITSKLNVKKLSIWVDLLQHKNEANEIHKWYAFKTGGGGYVAIEVVFITTFMYVAQYAVIES